MISHRHLAIRIIEAFAHDLGAWANTLADIAGNIHENWQEQAHTHGPKAQLFHEDTAVCFLGSNLEIGQP